MTQWNIIIDPKTKKQLNIFKKSGKLLLTKYLNQIGGSNTKPQPSLNKTTISKASKKPKQFKIKIKSVKNPKTKKTKTEKPEKKLKSTINKATEIPDLPKKPKQFKIKIKSIKKSIKPKSEKTTELAITSHLYKKKEVVPDVFDHMTLENIKSPDCMVICKFSNNPTYFNLSSILPYLPIIQPCVYQDNVFLLSNTTGQLEYYDVGSLIDEKTHLAILKKTVDALEKKIKKNKRVILVTINMSKIQKTSFVTKEWVQNRWSKFSKKNFKIKKELQNVNIFYSSATLNAIELYATFSKAINSTMRTGKPVILHTDAAVDYNLINFIFLHDYAKQLVFDKMDQYVISSNSKLKFKNASHKELMTLVHKYKKYLVVLSAIEILKYAFEMEAPRIESSNVILYRGIKETTDYTLGQKEHTTSILSTSTHKNVTKNFIGNKCCIITIHVPVGMPYLIVPYGSYAKREHEILLPPGLDFIYKKSTEKEIEAHVTVPKIYKFNPCFKCFSDQNMKLKELKIDDNTVLYKIKRNNQIYNPKPAGSTLQNIKINGISQNVFDHHYKYNGKKENNKPLKNGVYRIGELKSVLIGWYIHVVIYPDLEGYRNHKVYYKIVEKNGNIHDGTLTNYNSSINLPKTSSKPNTKIFILFRNFINKKYLNESIIQTQIDFEKTIIKKITTDHGISPLAYDKHIPRSLPLKQTLFSGIYLMGLPTKNPYASEYVYVVNLGYSKKRKIQYLAYNHIILNNSISSKQGLYIYNAAEFSLGSSKLIYSGLPLEQKYWSNQTKHKFKQFSESARNYRKMYNTENNDDIDFESLPEFIFNNGDENNEKTIKAIKSEFTVMKQWKKNYLKK